MNPSGGKLPEGFFLFFQRDFSKIMFMDKNNNTTSEAQRFASQNMRYVIQTLLFLIAFQKNSKTKRIRDSGLVGAAPQNSSKIQNESQIQACRDQIAFGLDSGA